MLKKLLFLTVLMSMLYSCAVSSKVSTAETYRAADFSPAKMEEAGMAILPVTAGADLEGYRRPFGDELNRVAASTFEGVVPWDRTMNLLNEKGLVKEYQEAVQAYNETAILDKSITRQMADALGVRYLLYVRLAPPESSSDMRYDYVSGGAYQQQTKAVFAYAKVWDAQGDIVWEGSSEARAVSGAYSYINESIQEQCEKTANALVKRLAGLPVE